MEIISKHKLPVYVMTPGVVVITVKLLLTKRWRTREALEQIKEREYVEKFKKENSNKKIFAVAICYDSNNKDHSCKIEELN